MKRQDWLPSELHPFSKCLFGWGGISLPYCSGGELSFSGVW